MHYSNPFHCGTVGFRSENAIEQQSLRRVPSDSAHLPGNWLSNRGMFQHLWQIQEILRRYIQSPAAFEKQSFKTVYRLWIISITLCFCEDGWRRIPVRFMHLPLIGVSQKKGLHILLNSRCCHSREIGFPSTDNEGLFMEALTLAVPQLGFTLHQCPHTCCVNF